MLREALPGGKFEINDVNLRTTALRELHEELNIAPHNVQVLGQLPQYSTLTGFTIRRKNKASIPCLPHFGRMTNIRLLIWVNKH